MGTEVLITKGSPLGGQFSPTCSPVPNFFTLRELFARASISGNSMAAELGRCLTVNESIVSSSFKEVSAFNDAFELGQFTDDLLDAKPFRKLSPDLLLQSKSVQALPTDLYLTIAKGYS
jgi:hypothetical protein